jgi:serine/threonine protein phosphatase PrpC
MAAAAANHVVAAKIILEEAPEAVLEVDLQGRTALHIAAELGCMDMVDLLKSMHPEGPDAPVDLTGHTPLGRAITSQHREAKQNQSQLKEKLFSPGDVSVCGRPTPAKTRSSKLDLQQLVYGFSDMPGMRVMREDAISCHVWHGHALLGVCDGHGDHGLVSKFVADGVADILKKQLSATEDVAEAWTTACLDLDSQLKDTGRKGGSTAVWALVTDTSITVANVGDSRCILIQKPSLEQAMESLKLREEKIESPEKSEAEEKQATNTQLRYIVTPMSEDHKPNLELEQARIEKAGLSVVAETFMEDGVEQTIHKVQRSGTDRMAVSRSFGDFEYKSNTELAADEQAVVATPEIRVHTRDKELDMYLVLACDGVWDVMSSQEVADFVVSSVDAAIGAEEEDILPKVGDRLLNECLQRGSTDNMTTVIVALSKAAESLGGSIELEAKALDFQAE